MPNTAAPVRSRRVHPRWNPGEMASSAIDAPITRNQATVCGSTSSNTDTAIAAPMYCEIAERRKSASGGAVASVRSTWPRRITIPILVALTRWAGHGMRCWACARDGHTRGGRSRGCRSCVPSRPRPPGGGAGAGQHDHHGRRSRVPRRCRRGDRMLDRTRSGRHRRGDGVTGGGGRLRARHAVHHRRADAVHRAAGRPRADR